MSRHFVSEIHFEDAKCLVAAVLRGRVLLKGVLQSKQAQIYSSLFAQYFAFIYI